MYTVHTDSVVSNSIYIWKWKYGSLLSNNRDSRDVFDGQVTNFVFKLGDRAPGIKEVLDLLVVFQTGCFFVEDIYKPKVFDNLT